jgi:uncharacterized membrane protein
MNEHERTELVAAYLKQLAQALGDVPKATRRELLEDVRNHIEEAWASAPHQERADLLNILERLGPPELVAREQRERLGIPEATEGRSWLAPIAVVLTALFWPVGITLAWLSTRWGTRDKVIATALPIAGLLAFLTLSLPASVAFQAAPVITRQTVVTTEGQPAPQQAQPTGSSPAVGPNAIILLLATAASLCGFFGAPLAAAIYLAWRLRRPAGARGAFMSQATQ